MANSDSHPASITTPPPLLLVFSGRPGTGKTTIAQAVCRHSGACYLPVDAVETALLRGGSPVGARGYAVVHELAVSNLLLGTSVVVDAVNSLPEARVGWHEAAGRGNARLMQVEVTLPDRGEHRRRVENRSADLVGHQVPSWTEVVGGEWALWNEARDGPRLRVDGTDSDQAATFVLASTNLA